VSPPRREMTVRSPVRLSKARRPCAGASRPSGRAPAAVIAVLLAGSVLLVSCAKRRKEPPGLAPTARASAVTAPPSPPPRVLYLGDAAVSPPAPSALPTRNVAPARGRCPPDMVDVQGRFCIDRYEATLVDAGSGNDLSPYYFPSPSVARREYERWQKERLEAKTEEGRLLPVPAPPEWEIAARVLEPMAVARAGSTPSGYLSGVMAARACERANKRLCAEEEWVVACRGEKNRKFPYGETYVEGKCNVYRATHPARVLHGNPSVGHWDPRLNEVDEGGDPLLRPTGGTPDCHSDWGTDAVYDMVGNLDEWIDDPDGTFVGGFYARSTREGCDARIEVHAYEYYDYSLGVRCCR